jgi:WD40 repeat protein
MRKLTIFLLLLLIVQSACGTTNEPQSLLSPAEDVNDTPNGGDSGLSVFPEDGACYATAHQDVALLPFPKQGELAPAGTLPGGSAAPVWVRTMDGQYGIDGGQPEGIQLGIFHYLWIPANTITAGLVELRGRCETPLPVYDVSTDCFAVAQKNIDSAHTFDWIWPDGSDAPSGAILTGTKPIHIEAGQFASVEQDEILLDLFGNEGLVEIWSEPTIGNIGSDSGGVPIESVVFVGACDSILLGGAPIPTVDLHREPIGLIPINTPPPVDSTCHLTPGSDLVGHIVPDDNSPARSHFEVGVTLQVKAQTTDGWLAVDPDDGQEGLGLFRYAWIPADNITNKEGPCDGVPVAFWTPSAGICYFVPRNVVTLIGGTTLNAETDVIPVTDQTPDGMIRVSGMVPARFEIEGSTSLENGQLFGECGEWAIASGDTSTDATNPATSGIGPENLDQVVVLYDGYLKDVETALIDMGLVPVEQIKLSVSSLAYSPDGRFVAIAGCGSANSSTSCGNRNTQDGGSPFLFILDPKNGSLITSIPENEDFTTIDALAFTPDGNKLIYATRPGKLAVWDIPSAKIESEFEQFDENTQIKDPRVSPDGHWVAYVVIDLTSGAGIFRARNLENGGLSKETPINVIKRGYPVAETSATGWGPQFSGDSRRLLVSTDEAFIIYDTTTWNEIGRHPNPCAMRCNLAASPDLSTLVVLEMESTVNGSPAGPPASVRVWDLSTGEQLQDLTDDMEYASLMTFSPDGRLLFGLTIPPYYIFAWDTAKDWTLMDTGDPSQVDVIRYREFADDGISFLQWDQAGLVMYRIKPAVP